MLDNWKERHVEYIEYYCKEYAKLLINNASDDSKIIKRYETKADLFYSRYLMLAPGKSYPMTCAPPSDEERRAYWEAWCKCQAENDMLDYIAKLEKKVEELEED